MTMEPSFPETRPAVIERRLPEVLIIRYRKGIAEVIAACERVAMQPLFGVATMLPADGRMDMASIAGTTAPPPSANA